MKSETKLGQGGAGYLYDDEAQDKNKNKTAKKEQMGWTGLTGSGENRTGSCLTHGNPK